VGDITFQKKCLGKMRDAGYTGKTVLVVSHNMEMIASICHRAILVHGGRCIADNEVGQVISAYERNSRSKGMPDDRLKRAPTPQKTAWIDWLEIRDDQRNHRTIFEHGDYLNLLIGIRGHFPPAAYLEWILTTERGYVATSGGTFMKARDISLPPLSGALRARIGPMPLAEGRYILSLRLGVLPGREFLDVWEESVSVLISNYVPEPGGIPFDVRRGVVYIPADYSDANEWR
jgi:hypothetical protein